MITPTPRTDLLLKYAEQMRRYKSTIAVEGCDADWMADRLCELAAAKKALAARNKQLGVACMKHDLVHALACGYCLKEAQKALKAAEARTEELAQRNIVLRAALDLARDRIAGHGGVLAAIDSIAEGKK